MKITSSSASPEPAPEPGREPKPGLAPAPGKKRPWLGVVIKATLVLATLVTIFYVEENWRSARAWDRVRESLKSKKEPLTMEDLLPTVPDEKNFFAADIIQSRFHQETPWLSFKDNVRLHDGFVATQTKSGGYDLPAYLKWLRDHAAWPLPPETGKTGADILAVLSPADAGLAALREAMARPETSILPWQTDISKASKAARFTIETARLYHLRRTALLHDRDAAGAAAECLQALRFIQRFCARSTSMMQALVACAMAGNTLTMLRESSGHIPWSADDLQKFEAELATLDLSARFANTLRGERVFVLSMVEPWPDGPMKAMGLEMPLGAKFLPSGWKHLWLAGVCEALQERIEGIEKDGLRIEIQRRRPIPWLPPQPFAIDQEQFLNYDRVATSILQFDAQLHIIRVAFAAARWRLAKGSPPATLTDLQEYFPAGIPDDPMTGKPLEYSPAPDGGFSVAPSGGKQSALYDDLTWKVPPPASS